MAGEANLVTSAAILKTKYTQPKVYWIAYKENPGFTTVRKDTTFDGANKVIAVQTETPQGRGSTIAQAQANIQPGVYKNFLLTRIEDFGVARVKGQAMRAAAKNTGALVDLWTREMDGILLTVVRSAAINFWRTGTGSRGQVSSGSTVSSNVITLALASDITNFSVGMTVQATPTDGAAPRTGQEVIKAIDRVAATITSTAAAWNTNITALATSDFLVMAGDYKGATVAGANTMVTGVQGYIPPTGSTRPQGGESFFGLDRSVDPIRLAGTYLDGTGVPMQEALLEGIAISSVEGAAVDKIWMHPRDRQNLVKELGAKAVYTRVDTKVPGSEARVGFDGLKFESEGMECLVMSDINIPRGHAFPTQWDTWAFESLGPAPQILNFDSNEFLRVTNDDSYEVRTGYYGQVSNGAPAYTNHISGFGL